MENLSAFCYLGLFFAAGLLLALCTLRRRDLPAIICLGCTYTVALLAALPALFALFFGFGGFAVLLAGACAGLLLCGSAFFLLTKTRRTRAGILFSPEKQKDPWFWICVLPLFLWTCELFFTHTLSPDGAGGYLCGQSTFGDLPMHLSFITHIAESGTFPPTYPLLLDNVPMGYPFLCESVSSVFLVLGAPLRTACLLPQLVALFSVLGFAFLLARELLASSRRAAVAFMLFFLGSGLGVFYFLKDKETFLSIFTGYYTTPTNHVAENICWVNPIADLLIPQRATLFGWCILFCCLFLLWRFAFAGEARLWLPLGLLGGVLPLIHTHSFLALAICSGVLFVRAVLLARKKEGNLRPWLLYAALAAALSVPQVFFITLPQAGGEGFVRFYTNWANHGKDNYFWFYLKNIGLVWVLLIPAFFHANRRQRWFYAGGAVLWAICEVVVFQPNPYDNNKLLYVWHLLGCILTAQLLCDFIGRLSKKPLRAAVWCALGLLVCSGSLLTLLREQNSRYLQFDAPQVGAAKWSVQNTEPDALFLTAENHNNAIAALAGRQIVCGSGSYLFYHGIHYSAAASLQQALFEAPSVEALAKAGVDYVLIGPYERGRYEIDYAFFEQNCRLVYENGQTLVFAVGID